MRLDRYLANSGIGTRKEVKKIIHQKRVSVNGILVNFESAPVDENNDIVLVDGDRINYQEFYYFLLNKPKDYVSAIVDNIHPPVTDLMIGYDYVDLFPVGRLDVDTTGSLLMTNDGDLCHKLLSPKYHVDKTYAVETNNKIDKAMIEAVKKGIRLDDGELTLPGELVIIDDTHAELTIHQGKFHQVKRMFAAFGLKVVNLDRKLFAFLDHEGMFPGTFRELTKEEVNKLKELVNN